jgi:hypothetical protein
MIEPETHTWCHACGEAITEPSDIYIWNAYLYHERCLPRTETAAETAAKTYADR